MSSPLIIMMLMQTRLFGQLELLQGDRPCHLPVARNARVLLAYLLLHPKRAFPRPVLADLIAPDSSEAQAQHALSQALWHIRRALPELLQSDAGQVGIAQQVEMQVDALEFRALAESSLNGAKEPAGVLAGLQRAVELYRGDL
ncbi:MAG: hypothetical protein EHM70_00595, partial [Chloroflexota bacterium]